MSVRRDRGKAAFLPSDRNLGGASQIIDEYRHFQKRINAVQPSTVEIARAKVQVSSAALTLDFRQMSRYRAACMAAWLVYTPGTATCISLDVGCGHLLHHAACLRSRQWLDLLAGDRT